MAVIKNNKKARKRTAPAPSSTNITSSSAGGPVLTHLDTCPLGGSEREAGRRRGRIKQSAALTGACHHGVRGTARASTSSL